MTIAGFKYNAEEVSAKVVSIRRRMRQASRRIGDQRGIFRKVDKAIDRIVRESFDRGWPERPWALATFEARQRESGYYARTPRTTTEVGRWTDDMYEGLLGKGVLGEKRFRNRLYIRAYRDRGSRGTRVVWFHEGNENQPARPFWAPKERSLVARKIFREEMAERIGGLFE
jgi:hypothetical protein